MIDKKIERILNQAFTDANKARYEFFTTEHMLLALCEKDLEIREELVEIGVDITEVIKDLHHFIRKNTPKLTSENENTMPTSAFHRIVERATSQRRSAGKEVAHGIHLLIAIMEESESHAVYYLKKQGLSKLDLMHLISRTEKQEEANSDEEDGEEESPLTKYCVNLNEQAKIGAIDPLIGRDEEVQRIIQILCRRRKNNPILVGEAGVGKTAIAEGLAKLIVDGKTPAVLKDTTIYSVDLGSMVAGSKYRGDFEKRIKSLINALKNEDDSIIFIDEIHTLMGAGSTSDSTLDASNLLKPALSYGELRCIGATTYKEFKNSFAKNAALARRFQKVDITEPSKADTVAILQGLQERFESFHKVKYSPAAIEYAVELADKYIHDRHLPDKAIDLIDEAGAKARIQIPPKRRINEKDVERVLASIAKIPEKTISTGDKRILKGLEKRLQQQIFGQDRAIEALASAIKLSRAGLKNIEQPIGSFLFTGPTGVGKTEVSKALAHEMGMEFVRFDMSEYMEAHSVSRLIGSPPGYVGYDDGGLLTEAVSNTPHCVLLLDEIEKAHPDVFNLLLQIMDYGRLTDNNGKNVNFSNVILIMTSNAGASNLEKNTMGFTLTKQPLGQDTETALKRVFTPEFRNRISDTIVFEQLSKTVILRIIDKLIDRLAKQLAQQDISICVEKSAKLWLVEHGYSPLMGARPLSRLIDRSLKQPLSEKILFGNLKKGGEVVVSHHAGDTGLDIASKQLIVS